MQVITSLEAVAGFGQRVPNPDQKSTGFGSLDDVTGGFRLGQVWIVCGTPGQGRSTLAVQWALRLATEHAMRTDLTNCREPLGWVMTRLLACSGKIPVSHLWSAYLSSDEEIRLARACDVVGQAPLRLADSALSSLASVDLDASEMPEAFVVDDADLGAGTFPSRIASIASQGILVILTLPRHLVVSGDGIDPDWARAADFILDLQRPDLLDHESLRPGEADIHLVRNRWGPQLLTTVAFQGHYARLVEMVR